MVTKSREQPETQSISNPDHHYKGDSPYIRTGYLLLSLFFTCVLAGMIGMISLFRMSHGTDH